MILILSLSESLKPMRFSHFPPTSRRVVSSLFLTSLLSLSSSSTSFFKGVAADSALFNHSGTLLSQSVNLPSAVRRAVLAEASVRSQQPVSNLRIMNARAINWAEGCDPNSTFVCTRPVISGWEVMVELPNRDRWTFRTDSTGDLVSFVEDTPTQTGTPANSVVRAVVRDLSRRTRIPTRNLSVVNATRQTWSDNCLGLAQPGEFCGQSLVEGWRLQLTDNRRTWFYRTDSRGRVVRLEEGTTADSSILPGAISKRVITDLANQLGVNASQLRILNATQQIWPDGCLGLGSGACTFGQVPGWEVVVGLINNSQQWIYRTNDTGSIIRLAQGTSSGMNTGLPSRIATILMEDLSWQTGRSAQQFRVQSATRQTWPNGCLGLSLPNVRCTSQTVPGWRVTLTDGQNSWVYRTDGEGQVRFLETDAQSQSDLPDNVANLLLRDAARRSQFPTSAFRIVNTERQQWSDSCLGIRRPDALCLPMRVMGWEVTLEGGSQTWVYHVNEAGTQMVLARTF